MRLQSTTIYALLYAQAYKMYTSTHTHTHTHTNTYTHTHTGDSSSLAAMGPANMIKSFATYVFQSLQVATL